MRAPTLESMDQTPSCSQCGLVRTPGANFCRRCGLRLPDVASPAVSPPRRFADPKIAEAIGFAKELLATAELGLADARSSDPRRWTSGLYVAIVFGRSVTLALQNGRSEDPAFEDWYQSWQRRMKDDVLLSAMDQLRVSIVHKVGPAARHGGTIVVFDDVPGFEGCLLEAPSGGLLNTTTRSGVIFEGSELDGPMDFHVERYLAYLGRLVEDAEATFGERTTLRCPTPVGHVAPPHGECDP